MKQLIEVQLRGEVRKNVEEQVVQFTDIVKQQLEEEMKTQVDKSLETVTEDLQKVRTSLTTAEAQAKEQREKEDRRNNLILYSVPESGEDRGQERNKKDREFCLQLFNYVLQAGIDDNDILRSFRLGRWNGEGNMRPLMVQLASY